MADPWEVVYSDEFEQWVLSLSEGEQVDVMACVTLLETKGPNLARPYADTLYGSNYSNMKELRIQHNGKPYRAAYAFDPERKAVLLCGGNKKGKNEKKFYNKLIATADRVYQRHLEQQKQEAQHG